MSILNYVNLTYAGGGGKVSKGAVEKANYLRWGVAERSRKIVLSSLEVGQLSEGGWRRARREGFLDTSCVTSASLTLWHSRG